MGFSCLFIAAFIDSMRGPLLPYITHSLDIPYAKSSLFLVLGCMGGLTASLLSIPFLNRYTEKSLTAIGLVVVLAMAIMARWVDSLTMMLILGVAAGVGSTILGLLSNIFVQIGASPENKTRYLAILHSMFGVGSAVAVFTVGKLLKYGFSWQHCFHILLTPTIFVGIILALSGRNKPKTEKTPEKRHQPSALSKIQILILVCFALYVAGEVLATSWMVSFLMEEKNIQVDKASTILSGFFVLLSLTRVICFFVRSTWILEKSLIPLLLIASTSLLIGVLVNPYFLILGGLVGPFFPVFLGAISNRFPDQWRSLTIWVVVTMQITVGLLHLVLGYITSFIAISNAYLIPPILLLCVIPFLIYFRSIFSTRPV